MKIIKISEATTTQIDYLVAQCEDAAWVKYDEALHADEPTPPRPSEFLRDYSWKSGWKPATDPAQGLPILEREKIDLLWEPNGKPVVLARCWIEQRPYHAYGPTMLIAGLRCFLASKLGETVEVPDEIN